MDKRLQQTCSIKLHYRHGIATVVFHDDTVSKVIHSYEKVVADLYEVFTLYKAYERFIGIMGWHLLAAYLAGEYGVSIEGKPVEQVVKEIVEAQQKELGEMGEYV